MTTTPRKTTRKVAPRKAAEKETTALTGAEVVRKTDEELLEEEKTATQVEVEAEGNEGDEEKPRTFTAEINGEEVTLADLWDREGKIPPIAAMMSSDVMAAKLSGPIVMQLIGEDQLIDLVMRGVSQDEYMQVINAWAEARGLKN